MKPEIFLSKAIELALKAADEISSLINSPSIHHQKADASIVTLADLKSDEIIVSGLSDAFPDHHILSEETGLKLQADSEFTWVVDPLDGTKAYAKKIPGFSVMIGLLKNQEPYLGVVVDPLKQEVFEAIRGDGAYCRSKTGRTRLKVSQRKDYTHMPLIFSPGFPENILNYFTQTLHSPALPPINSVGIKVGLLVKQDGDLYLNHHPVHYWDTCAPQIILEEAGGVMTDWLGAPLTYHENETFHPLPTLATNQQRHSDVLKILKNFLPNFIPQKNL